MRRMLGCVAESGVMQALFPSCMTMLQPIAAIQPTSTQSLTLVASCVWPGSSRHQLKLQQALRATMACNAQHGVRSCTCAIKQCTARSCSG